MANAATQSVTQNGAERLFNKWNRHAKNNNCYAFAFGALREDSPAKLQPGELSGLPDIPDSDKYQCTDLVARILQDYPAVKVIGRHEKTTTGLGHRVALFVDNVGEKRDYHFYREMPDGTWWHKPGSLPVSKVDDSGKAITDPLDADRDYTRNGDESSGFNYATFCSMFWVPDGVAPVTPLDELQDDPEDGPSGSLVLLVLLLLLLLLCGVIAILFPARSVSHSVRATQIQTQ